MCLMRVCLCVLDLLERKLSFTLKCERIRENLESEKAKTRSIPTCEYDDHDDEDDDDHENDDDNDEERATGRKKEKP